jgi:glycosyltransferase involved in cell wall biosynthesis
MRTDLESIYGQDGGRVIVAPNAISDPGLQNSKRREGLLCAARLDASKGQDVLIRAAAHDPDLPDITFVGGGPQRTALETLARSLGVADRCRFIGRLQRPQLLALMASSVAVVVPSRAEAFGWVAIEAMSAATPVVASDTGGLSEILRGGGGILCPVGDHIALADAITRLIGDADRLGRAARRSFEMTYNTQTAVPCAVDAVMARHPKLGSR